MPRHAAPGPEPGDRPESDAHALLSAIVDSSDDAIISKDLNGTITSWNPSAQRIFGYTPDEAIGRSITLLIPRDRLDEERAILERLERGERVDHFETLRLRKDGSLLDISLTISPIKGRDGRIIGASKFARDISERKRAEAELRRQRAVVDQMYQVGLSLSAEDVEKLLQSVTDLATELTGAKFGAFFYNAFDEAQGHYLLFTLAGALREDFDELGMPRNTALFAETFTGKGNVRLDDVTRDPRFGRSAPHYGMPRGHLHVTSYMAVPVVGRQGKVFGGFFFGHPQPGVFGEEAERIASALGAQAAIAIENAELYEIEQRLRREAEAAGRAKDEFLAMLGHELRNPLAAVNNAVSAAGIDPTCTEQALAIVRRGVAQLTRLVDDLLDVARVTQGKIALHRERVSFASIVERALQTAQPLVAERRQRLTTSLAQVGVDVHGDPIRLEQVVMNLLANAAKFTQPGGRIEVAVAREGDAAVLRVKDDGTGIAAELLPRIFDLFAQGDAELARTVGGLGIGLTVVRRLVELHGGRAEAHSRGPGTGAEFVIRLPALAPGERRACESVSREAPVEVGAQVLIVEDNRDAAASMAMLLERLGHRVQVVHDGKAAIQRARSDPPDLMLIDIGLPGIDGYEVARQLRSSAGGADLVLVALTGYGGPEHKQRALAAGFDHHFTKPVAPQALRALAASLR